MAIENYVEKKKENVVQDEKKNETTFLEILKEEKVPVVDIEKHSTILMEEKLEGKEKNNLFVPEIQVSLLPNSPQLDLPIPPINSDVFVPSFNLPPPPRLDLPPPLLSPPPSFDLPEP